MGREFTTAVLLGSLLAALAFMVVFVFQSTFGAAFMVYGLAIGTSVLTVVLFGGLAGALFPFALSRMGFDPAVCSTPFVTTVVDVSGLIIYFSLARSILVAFGV